MTKIGITLFTSLVFILVVVFYVTYQETLVRRDFIITNFETEVIE